MTTTTRLFLVVDDTILVTRLMAIYTSKDGLKSSDVGDRTHLRKTAATFLSVLTGTTLIKDRGMAGIVCGQPVDSALNL